MSARKIGFLILILAIGAALETSWALRGHLSLGPQGCRVLGGRFYGPSWSFEASVHRRLAPGTPPFVEVENAFGGVLVSAGETGVVEARLRKVVYLPTEERARAFAERIELRVEEDGERLRITTNRDELARREDTGFETHLELIVPRETALRIRNEHGAVEARDVAGAEVRSSFEDVALERVAGAVVVEVRHGAVRVSEAGSSLEVSARHGDVDLSSVAGRSTLDVQHGRVATRRTGGLELTLRHGELVADTVAGDLRVSAEHSGIRAERIEGRLEVMTSHEDVRASRVGGDAEVRVQHGSIEAEDITGTFLAEASHGDVEVQGLRGAAEIQVASGSVRIAPGGPLTEPVTASATHGDVRLEVDPGSHFDLEAEARRGEVRADAPGLELAAAEGGVRRVRGRFGGGGNPVRLTADGDVEVVTRSGSRERSEPDQHD